MCNTHSKPLNSPRQPRSMTTNGNIHHTWQTEHIVYNLAPAYVFSHVCRCSRATKCHDNINGTLAYATVIPYGASKSAQRIDRKAVALWCNDTRQNRCTWRAAGKMRAPLKKRQINRLQLKWHLMKFNIIHVFVWVYRSIHTHLIVITYHFARLFFIRLK